MFRGTIVRGRVTVPIACSVIATMLPFSAATVDAVSRFRRARRRRRPLPGRRAGCPHRGRGGAGDRRSPRCGCRGTRSGRWHLLRPRSGSSRLPTDAAPDTASKEALADTSGAVDPAKDEWTDPAPVDPALLPVESIRPPASRLIQPPRKRSSPLRLMRPRSPQRHPSRRRRSNTARLGGTEPWGEPIATAYIAGTGAMALPA